MDSLPLPSGPTSTRGHTSSNGPSSPTPQSSSDGPSSPSGPINHTAQRGPTSLSGSPNSGVYSIGLDSPRGPSSPSDHGSVNDPKSRLTQSSVVLSSTQPCLTPRPALLNPSSPNDQNSSSPRSPANYTCSAIRAYHAPPSAIQSSTQSTSPSDHAGSQSPLHYSPSRWSSPPAAASHWSSSSAEDQSASSNCPASPDSIDDEDKAGKGKG